MALSQTPSSMHWISRRSPSAKPVMSRPTVVRTPADALRDAAVRLDPARGSSLMSPPMSPAVPAVGLASDDEDRILLDSDASGGGPAPPPRPARRPSLRAARAEDAPSVPRLPAHIAVSTQPPPFSPILLSESPPALLDPAHIIVSLETSSVSYATTLTTLTSRPSHLSRYLSSLLSSPSLSSSVYSQESDHVPQLRRHLTSAGFLPTSYRVHIFLDRPSSPYPHILSYLRSTAVQGQPDVLPHALQLHQTSGSSPSLQHTRLQALLDVRDEAAYLNLEALHRLCVDEIRHRYGAKFHQRGHSSTSLHSLHASVYSLGTLQERVDNKVDDPMIHTNGTHTPASTTPPPPTTVTPLSPPQTAHILNGPVAPSTAAIALRRSKQLASRPSEPSISRSLPTPQRNALDNLNPNRTSLHNNAMPQSATAWI